MATFESVSVKVFIFMHFSFDIWATLHSFDINTTFEISSSCSPGFLGLGLIKGDTLQGFFCGAFPPLITTDVYSNMKNWLELNIYKTKVELGLV